MKTIYETSVKKNEALLSSLWVELFVHWPLLAESIKLLMRYHWFQSSSSFRFFSKTANCLCDVIRLKEIILSSRQISFWYLARKSCKFLYICIWMRCSCETIENLHIVSFINLYITRLPLYIFFTVASIAFCISSYFFNRYSLLCLVSLRIKFN